MQSPMNRLMMALLLSLAGPLAAAPRLEVAPAAEVLQGEPQTLALSGATPGERLTLRLSRRATLPGIGPALLRAEALFEADAQGRIDPERQAPLSGSYAGVDGRGLFWSALPVRGEPQGVPAADAPAGQLLLEALGRDAEGAPHRVAELNLRWLPAEPLVQGRNVASLPGARLVWPKNAAAALPVVIVLGGSEGGSSTAVHMAEALAARGLAALALPYYSPPRWGAQGPMAPELPALPTSFAHIELGLLETARNWLREQPEVDASRIALWGASKGGEFVLAGASRIAGFKGVVAVVPSDVIWEGFDMQRGAMGQPSFSWQGKPLHFVPYQGYAEEVAGFMSGQPVLLRRPHDAGRASHAEAAAAARIEVEKIAAPVLLIAGSDDQVWDSGGMARSVAARRASAGLKTELMVFEGAGHGITSLGGTPTALNNAGPMKLGGQPAADARAQQQGWARTISFLREVLR
ncbi:acyl-CoA thioesterase/bile acid-CoA:amino acid N-acyltransferase family protein [Paucibacter sp. APW11]|uniref:Acyl-CoA thioesterase/bile acid-CoA:amino acid N-acyltransferase family protein n=1 Tax=Roseateles aquae TaxID=3077235 RepID=A0ABU3PE78_9BURK|nr:acyl-CoA thioesterase/bile acid-CoA:amino acid N-acyltransferase family protein [Paucibacter sp. APW11]MDT9000874.1 acyl-CoA thioesterase/bile acid-CoA:amino acid N-acyltransferase family protein [Paucibacter sp. APW11]